MSPDYQVLDNAASRIFHDRSATFARCTVSPPLLTTRSQLSEGHAARRRLAGSTAQCSEVDGVHRNYIFFVLTP